MNDLQPATDTETAADGESLVAQVRERYGRIAAESGSCCSGSCGTSPTAAAERLGYDAASLAGIPAEANLGLGCGTPLAFLDLQPGETVLDLGSGPGVDALLAARAVGPEGRVIGVDMTPEMLGRARAAAVAASVANVEFRAGRLEELPVESATVDAATSNCVINLVPDKARVFREVARVLRPGGRLVISDIVLDAPLPAAVERDLLAYVGCVAGAMLRGPYFASLAAAGFAEVEVLRDLDALPVLSDSAEEELRQLAVRAGAGGEELEQLRGKVRSVTYRARRA